MLRFPWQATTLCVLVLARAATAGAQAPDMTVRVAARDGTELATDVYLPPGTGPFPTLLRRTPYGRAVDAGLAGGTRGLGYALVSQDVRGRGDSDGEFLPFLDDASDGAATLDWITAQAWSNGRVGTFGGSAEGIVQYMLLGEGHPAHACAHVTVATDDLHEVLYAGGAWRPELTDRWLEALGETQVRAPFRAHEARADPYWARGQLDDAERARVSIPVMHVGGFFDIFSVGTPRTFAALAGRADPAARPDQLLMLGPWSHGSGGLGSVTQGEVTWSAEAQYSAYAEELVGFFEWCLKGRPRPDVAPVRYYLTRLGDDGRSATGEWRDESTWPPPDATPTPLYLHPDGLSALPPDAAAPPRVLPVDPAAPVPSTGGSAFTETPGPHDQSALDARADVLALDTPVAERDVELAGDVVARVWAASSGTDADVVVRLSEVTPSGRVMVLADGVRRGRFVASLDGPAAPLVPDVPSLFEVAVGPLAITLPAGHALRVALSGTLSPRFEPNPGTDAPLAGDPVGSPYALSIRMDPEHPSAVVLPVLAGVLPGPASPSGDAGPAGDAGTPSLDAGDPGAPSRDGGALDAGPRPTGGRDDDGCGCTAPGRTGRAEPLASVSLVIFVVVWLRRRRRDPTAPAQR